VGRLIFFSGYGRPALTVTLVPDAKLNRLTIWQDDFGGDALPASIAFEGLAGFAIDAPNLVVLQSLDAYFDNPVTDLSLQTRVDESDAFAIWSLTDEDQYMALELESNLPQPLMQFAAYIEDPLSIPRYKQDGSTLDCDTSVPLVGSLVYVLNQNSGTILAQGVSNGVGLYSLPVFELGPHQIEAVNGTKTAISLPVLATPV
jgi:hypothetical protein